MRLFTDTDLNTHMPFVFEGKTLFFCAATTQDYVFELQGRRAPKKLKTVTKYKKYDIAYCDINIDGENTTHGEIKFIKLDRPDLNDVNCSPHAWRDDDGYINLSYIKMNTAGFGIMKFAMMIKKGKTIETLGEAVRCKDVMGLRPYSGFDNKHYRAVANTILTKPMFVVYDKENSDEIHYKVSGTRFLRRISFIPNEPHKMILTYPDYKGDYASSIFDLKKLETSKINCAFGAYKCTIENDTIINAHNYGNETDTYEMALHSSSYEIDKFKGLKIKEIRRFQRPMI